MSAGAAELLPGAGERLGFPDLADGAAGTSHVARSPLQLFWRRFRRDRVALVSLGFIVVLILVAIAAPLVVSLLGLPGPDVQSSNLTNAFGSPLGPSLAHPFGVDPLGQDVSSRVIYGTRVSLSRGNRRHRHRGSARHDRRAARRLLPRRDRHAALAPDRRHARDSRAAARPRNRVRLLAGEAVWAVSSSRAWA